MTNLLGKYASLLAETATAAVSGTKEQVAALRARWQTAFDAERALGSRFAEVATEWVMLPVIHGRFPSTLVMASLGSEKYRLLADDWRAAAVATGILPGGFNRPEAAKVLAALKKLNFPVPEQSGTNAPGIVEFIEGLSEQKAKKFVGSVVADFHDRKGAFAPADNKTGKNKKDSKKRRKPAVDPKAEAAKAIEVMTKQLAELDEAMKARAKEVAEAAVAGSDPKTIMDEISKLRTEKAELENKLASKKEELARLETVATEPVPVVETAAEAIEEIIEETSNPDPVEEAIEAPPAVPVALTSSPAPAPTPGNGAAKELTTEQLLAVIKEATSLGESTRDALIGLVVAGNTGQAKSSMRLLGVQF